MGTTSELLSAGWRLSQYGVAILGYQVTRLRSAGTNSKHCPRESAMDLHTIYTFRGLRYGRTLVLLNVHGRFGIRVFAFRQHPDSQKPKTPAIASHQIMGTWIHSS